MNNIMISFNRIEKTDALCNIENAIKVWREADDKDRRDKLVAVLEAIRMAIINGDRFIIPVELPQEFVDSIDVDKLKVGNNLDIPDELHCHTELCRERMDCLILLHSQVMRN